MNSGSRAEAELTRAISWEMARLYRDFYGHDRATATTYLNDNIVVCVLEDILTVDESRLVEFGDSRHVLEGRVAFQTQSQDEFTAVVERLMERKVVAFLSANQATPGVACELFFLERAATAAQSGGPL
ncbi:MAG: Na-translocating system protein MpsC family protein [Solirubrobacteraceae bacterium]